MSETKSFWTTLPGILTGIAGLITAIGGVMVILCQVGVIVPKLNSTSANGLYSVPQKKKIPWQSLIS